MTFRARGSQLVPGDPDESEFHATHVFDTATAAPVRLRLPGRYRPGADNPDLSSDSTFTIFEWLDDDTVALRHADDSGTDIVTCRLSDGRCLLVARNQQHLVMPTTPGSAGWNIPE